MKNNRVKEVVSIIGQRLINIKRFVSAGEIYEDIGEYERAVDAYKDAVGQVPKAEQTKLMEKIRNLERQYNPNARFDDPIDDDDGSGNLEGLYKAGKYEQCLNEAEKVGSEVLNDYLERYSKQLVKNGDWQESSRILYQYGCPPVNNIFPIYKTIALEVLAGDNLNELTTMKEMLKRLVDNLSLSYDENNMIFKEFSEYLLINHFLLLKMETQGDSSNANIHCKLCISLLRYTKIVRADKAFLDAGNACKDLGIDNMAFILLNRYLELAEAIEDPNSAALEEGSGDFEGTDIPSPFEIPLPENNILSENDREDLRDWVLQIQMDNDVERVLNMRQCEETGEDVYEASLINPHTNEQYDACIVSGYPLLRSNMITCKFCSKGAVRDYWNEYVTVAQKCPWCSSIQTPF
jgi:intraflagellar transport protein 172